jgi:septal ring factor EnvC (AmiA/AmiB activator)
LIGKISIGLHALQIFAIAGLLFFTQVQKNSLLKKDIEISALENEITTQRNAVKMQQSTITKFEKIIDDNSNLLKMTSKELSLARSKTDAASFEIAKLRATIQQKSIDEPFAAGVDFHDGIKRSLMRYAPTN